MRSLCQVREGLSAAVPAAILSGIPSTLHAFVTDRDPLQASLAAGSILLPDERDRGRLLAAAVPVHLALSGLWGIALALLLPRKKPLLEGALAGLAIATLDLGVVGRRLPRIRDLDLLPQVADHIAFGILTACALAGRRSDGARGRSSGPGIPTTAPSGASSDRSSAGNVLGEG